MALAASIQRVWPRIIAFYRFLWHLRPTFDPNIFVALFRRFVGCLKFLTSKWETWYGKQKLGKNVRSHPPLQIQDPAMEPRRLSIRAFEGGLFHWNRV